MVRSIRAFNNVVRSAFTIIELIFAIVVIGVTLLTVPLMIETNNKSLERSLSQEAIFLAAALLSSESTKEWDANSIVSTSNADEYVLAKILDVGALGATTYSRTNIGTVGAPIYSNVRQGGLREDKHRSFFDYNASVGAPNGGLSRPAQTQTINFVLPIDNALAAATDYKLAYTNSASRMYVADTGNILTIVDLNATVTNLKMIEVTVPVLGGGDVVLRTYTANIGEVDYAKRSF